MEEQSTKEKILDAALDLFSRNGYEAVSVDQIARAVGIKAPSLYKHYRSKQDLFHAIFTEMERRYEAQTAAMQMHFSDGSEDLHLFSEISVEDLVRKVQELVEYSLRDRYVSKFRKMLTVEQYRSPELAELYTRRYVDHLVNYHEKLFQMLVRAGVLRDENCHLMAVQYVSPVIVMLSLCDRQPEKEPEAMATIEAHIRLFNRMYQKEQKS